MGPAVALKVLPRYRPQLFSTDTRMNLAKNRRRICHLDAVIFLTGILKKRFGPRITLGEMHAAVIAHKRLLQRKPLTLSDLAERSGVNRQSISRWVSRVPWIRLQEHPDDGRAKLITPISEQAMEKAVSYLDAMWEDVKRRLLQSPGEARKNSQDSAAIKAKGVCACGRMGEVVRSVEAA